MPPDLFLLMLLLVFLVRWLLQRLVRARSKHYRKRRAHAVSLPPPSPGFPRKKPAWAKYAVLALHERLELSHRELADTFNHLYFASTGTSVGRTWVRELLKKQAYEALHLQQDMKHQVPAPLPFNALWGIDTTCVCDGGGAQHIVLGIVDHGARLCLVLRRLKRFNTWTFLGCLFLAIGQFGKPVSIKTDNHPVFHAKWVKRVLRWSGVSMRFAQPAKPWQNGRIERLFGTLKSYLHDYVIRDGQHLLQSLAGFQFWYNVVRSHQHLGGRTPYAAWCGINPYLRVPKTVCEFNAWNGRLRGLVLRH